MCFLLSVDCKVQALLLGSSQVLPKCTVGKNVRVLIASSRESVRHRLNVVISMEINHGPASQHPL